MKQFPFAHTLTMTYRVQDGALEVHTRIDSLSDEQDADCHRLPSVLPAHRLTSGGVANRGRPRRRIGCSTEQAADRTNQTHHQILPDPKNVLVKDVTLDDIFTDLERDERGRATLSLDWQGTAG